MIDQHDDRCVTSCESHVAQQAKSLVLVVQNDDVIRVMEGGGPFVMRQPVDEARAMSRHRTKGADVLKALFLFDCDEDAQPG